MTLGRDTRRVAVTAVLTTMIVVAPFPAQPTQTVAPSERVEPRLGMRLEPVGLGEDPSQWSFQELSTDPW